jgi:hypothetical protein
LPSSTQTTECSGRTQLVRPAPQRIDFGHGNLAATAGTTSLMISLAARPGLEILTT